jgi:hypothetical protein
MPSGAGQLSSGGGGQGRGAGAVTAEPSWVAERPGRRDPDGVGPPGGWSPGREDVRTLARPVVALSASSGPAVRTSVQPVERTSSVHASSVHASGVQPSGVQPSGVQVSGCPDGQASGSAALPPRSAPRRTWSGSVWRAAPVGRRGSTCPRGPRAAWSPDDIGPDGEGMVRRWPWLGGMRVAQGAAAGIPAMAPLAAGPTTNAVEGQVPAGWRRPRTEQVLIGPRGLLGQAAHYRPRPSGGDHAAWSLGWW